MSTKSNKATTVLNQIILTVIAAIFATPLVIMMMVSLQGEGIGNYIAVLTHPAIPRFFLNSLIVSASTIAIVFCVTILAAYAFSKLELPVKGTLMNLILMGLMIPSIALIVPLFLIVKSLGLFNNYLALIGPICAFTLPFTLLLAKNFMDDLPNQLMDAARIDGCGSFKTLLFIIAPLCKPMSVVVIIWGFLNSWNEYFLALVFMRKDTMQTITQAPQFFTGEYSVDIGKIFASLVLISLPVVIAYLSLQKYFEDGMTTGAIK
ncbi:carbohydrate ABC transporter permease [Paenibacillus sp. WQ 127069]|jgi:raffinose/stachyose/melibiose transport system permease protein|uniref:Carbohydrate ABC transporter permease n=1 Tax=Paenibacillus baimaensis TaxID=2982185 RepID=A0ABT2UGU8_9BACL|nr:carbohydrate ABC transporter permease [Paenibacillus sp. WQ 127069]MCU6793859.1 carbohydrate ABC transporter permease [Paenibacillus sp. WQ 127069]